VDGVAISLVLGSALWVQAQPPPKETAEAQVVDVEPEIPVPRMENDKLRWVGSFDKARAEAALRNVPILVVLGEDKNTGLSSMLGKVFFQQSFANAARDSIVPLIAMKGLDHDGDEQLVGGEPVKICKFFSVPCKEHDESFERLWSGMVFRSYWGPIMIFLRPDGSEILRIEGSEHGQERILEEIGYAVKQVGEGLGESAYCKQIDRVVRARKLLSSGQVQKALKELSRLESAGTEGFLEFERREREKIDAEGQAALAAILENAAAEHRNRTLNELRTLIRAYAGLPVEKQAQAALDQRDQD
jgi:hypothetical protein